MPPLSRMRLLPPLRMAPAAWPAAAESPDAMMAVASPAALDLRKSRRLGTLSLRRYQFFFAGSPM